MATQSNPYPLRIDSEIMAKTKVIAKGNGRSVNKEIEMLLKQTIIEFEKQNGTITVKDPSPEE